MVKDTTRYQVLLDGLVLQVPSGNPPAFNLPKLTAMLELGVEVGECFLHHSCSERRSLPPSLGLMLTVSSCSLVFTLSVSETSQGVLFLPPCFSAL